MTYLGIWILRTIATGRDAVLGQNRTFEGIIEGGRSSTHSIIKR